MTVRDRGSHLRASALHVVVKGFTSLHFNRAAAAACREAILLLYDLTVRTLHLCFTYYCLQLTWALKRKMQNWSRTKSRSNRRRDTFLSIEGCFLRDQFFRGPRQYGVTALKSLQYGIQYCTVLQSLLEGVHVSHTQPAHTHTHTGLQIQLALAVQLLSG